MCNYFYEDKEIAKRNVKKGTNVKGFDCGIQGLYVRGTIDRIDVKSLQPYVILITVGSHTGTKYYCSHIEIE